MKPAIGAKNGQRNGLSLLIDVDSFEYGQYPKSARGFILALSSMSERPMVRQEGTNFLIGSGARLIVIYIFKFISVRFI